MFRITKLLLFRIQISCKIRQSDNDKDKTMTYEWNNSFQIIHYINTQNNA